MEDLTIAQLQELADRTLTPSITLLLPTHRAHPETQQDPIRFRNLLREAERQLLDTGVASRDAEALLAPAQDLLQDPDFWRHQYDGLAVYLAPGGEFHAFRLPYTIDELALVSGSYYVKPLLPLVTNNGHFYLLALSQNAVRLFEGTRDSIGEIDLPQDLPRSLDDALPGAETERQLQFHTGTPQGGGRAAMFHGHGGGDEDQTQRIERYLNIVDAGLRPLLGAQRTPLVLAGVDYLLPLYRKVSEYSAIAEGGLPGNPERLSARDLHEQAWSIVEPHFSRETDETIALYGQLAGTGRATDSIDEVVVAAGEGRVDRLVLSADAPVWGTLDAATGRVLHRSEERTHEDHVALVDLAATRTLRNGGSVFAVSREEMPTDSPVVAILRY